MQQLRSSNRQLQIDIDCLTKEIDLFQARGIVCLSTSASVNVDFFSAVCRYQKHLYYDGYTCYLQNYCIRLSEPMEVIDF